jgi:DNA-binding HxlR family transcriptional regulator
MQYAYCMSITKRDAEHCSPKALKLLGDYTTLRIIDFLSESGLRFTDLKRALADTNAPTLIDRLKRMTGAGLLKRREATLDLKSVTYELSEDGKALIPVLREIKKFAMRHYPEKGRGP